MAKTKKLVGDQGIIFNNMFTTSPLCCPSRSSIFTGRYVHNHKALNNSVSGNCSSPAWQQTQEPNAFPTHLKDNGYETFFAGKYLNQYGFPATGGVEHVPPGWDNWYGLVGNSVYYNYALSVNGKREKHGDQYPQDYLTDVIHKRARQFLDDRHKWSDPFFMMLSTPACHAPFTPAPQHNSSFSNMTAPRNGSYNVKAQNKHWLIEQTVVPMPDDTVKSSDEIFRNRWRTLLSVDDMVEDILQTLDTKGILDNTYVFFSSDNGYHLGQFGLPYDKRQLYDFDIRVPLMVRGPGIKPATFSDEAVSNIDLAPTFLSLAGSIMPGADGVSFKDILHPQDNGTKPVRGTFLVEHTGEYSETIKGCPQYTGQNMNNCNNHCVCEDSKNNTFACIVQISKMENMKYCEFIDLQNSVEIYDLKSDPAELNNLYQTWQTTDPKKIASLERQLQYLATCSGEACHSVPT
ncbi:N-acetylglucosamine-6-sulfatase-like [Mercenaria mercenaria]|uniref:N-acetylglucosamine-6-sulfatase-like n=1 Tax=Mercenaria mercenaria TaxID=6596 RepID=UPI00234F2124|nr:N-acetylglucosamine-6-sulfatase-like [Mercenaria mercenaria]